MDWLIEFSKIIAFFAIGYLILLLFIWLVYRKRLSNFWGVLVTSLGAGLGFGTTVFLSTFLDEKSQTWSFVQRLSTSAEVFAWSFIASLISIPVVIEIHKAKKSLSDDGSSDAP